MFFAIDARTGTTWRPIGVTRQYSVHEALENLPSLLQRTEYALIEARVRAITHAEALKMAQEFVEINPRCPYCATKTKAVIFHGEHFYVCNICERIWPKS